MGTAKREKARLNKIKKANRVNELRSEEDRKSEIETLKNKLKTVGMPEYVSGYQKFVEVSDQFISTGENVDIKITFEELPLVEMILFLSNNKKAQCSITLKNFNGR